jgi:hypothetical protein
LKKIIIMTAIAGIALGLIAGCDSSSGTSGGGTSNSSRAAGASARGDVAPLNEQGPIPGFPKLRLTGSPVSITIAMGSCQTLPGMTDADGYVWATVTAPGVSGYVNLTIDGDSNQYLLPTRQLINDTNSPEQVCNTAGAGGPVTITEQTVAGDQSVQN